MLTEKERIERYVVTGGIPKYIETFSDNGDIFADIEKNVLSGQSYLYEKPLFLLSKKVRDIGSYFSIIKTIASGRCKQGEIASALEIKNTNNLPKYLNTLIDLDIYHKFLHKKDMVTWNRNDRTERFESFAEKNDNIILLNI